MFLPLSLCIFISHPKKAKTIIHRKSGNQTILCLFPFRIFGEKNYYHFKVEDDN